MNQSKIDNQPMRWQYGKLRSSHAWVGWVTLAMGIFALPLAWLLRNSIDVAGAPLSPWAVLLVGVTLAITGVLVSISLLRAKSRPPKWITISDGNLTIPGGLLVGAGWSMPLTDIKVRTTDLGFVKQLQLSGRRKRTTLSSALFSDDAEFDRLANTLQNVPGTVSSSDAKGT
ncbi:membrane protein [Rhodopirellula maiorica SM1]|uniref:Membrane protein n=1 Tax=Rhodopirellula maiorica SM1 TaxID=1265738 RepID=M5RAM4_9BACT|nr:membrane protein [Rhodopirellula maiorica]EMI16116.1 membrane protein [Rhodopirellula maiorica SM1]